MKELLRRTGSLISKMISFHGLVFTVATVGMLIGKLESIHWMIAAVIVLPYRHLGKRLKVLKELRELKDV